MKLLSRVRLFATPWTVAHQAPQSMEFSRQDYWSGLPFPSPADLPNPGIKPGSPAQQVDALPSEPPGKPQNKKGHYEDLPENPILRLHPKEISQKFNYFIVPFTRREKSAGINKKTPK